MGHIFPDGGSPRKRLARGGRRCRGAGSGDAGAGGDGRAFLKSLTSRPPVCSAQQPRRFKGKSAGMFTSTLPTSLTIKTRARRELPGEVPCEHSHL